MGDQEPGEVKDKPTKAQRTIHIVVAALVVVVLPVTLLDAFVARFCAQAMFIGVVFGVIGSLIGGTRRMLYVVPWFGLAAASERSRPMAGGGRCWLLSWVS